MEVNSACIFCHGLALARKRFWLYACMIGFRTLRFDERNDVFDAFIPMADKNEKNTFFVKDLYCRGLETARDAWPYNSSKTILTKNIKTTINFFNSETENYHQSAQKIGSKDIDEFVRMDDSKISWSRSFLTDAKNSRKKRFNEKSIVRACYRPFYKQNLYFSRELNNLVSRMDSFFPDPTLENLVIGVSGVGGSKDFSALMTSCIPDVQLQFNGQVFPLYYYEEQDKQSPTLWDGVGESDYIRRDGVSDFILERAKKMYGKNVSKEDIFYYVYGILHSPEYRTTFANDLKKTLPRIPLVEDVRDFWKFSKTGRQLAELHINYESVPPYKGVKVNGESDLRGLRVEKMRFPAKGQKDSIVYNIRITVSNIPAKAYEYVVNGKSAIEWVMERYQITTHAESSITNDPNDWAEEVGNPRYILDLLLSVIHVSVQTVELVSGLPKLKFE